MADGSLKSDRGWADRVVHGEGDHQMEHTSFVRRAFRSLDVCMPDIKVVFFRCSCNTDKRDITLFKFEVILL